MLIKCLVKNQILKRKDRYLLANHSMNELKLEVEFKSSEWYQFKNIYALFKNKENSYRVKMYKKYDKFYTKIPYEVLTGECFSITILGGNLLSTNMIVFHLNESGYTYKTLPCELPNDLFNIIINDKIDNVELDENILKFYGNEELIKSINLPLENYYDNIEKITDYLYKVYYSKLDYDYAFKYLENDDTGLCSSFSKDNFLCRNFDWLYDEYSEFVVLTENKFGRNATLGVASMTGLTNDEVLSGNYNHLYKILPFLIKDGINDKGLAISTNVVPCDYGYNTTTIPDIEIKDKIKSNMVVRYCLDNFNTARECVEYLKNYVSINLNRELQKQYYEQHWMIKDNDNCYIVEILDNKIFYYEYSIMTNFYHYNVEYNDDGTVYTPETQTNENNAIITNKITEYGCGLERYNLIINNYNNLEVKNDYIELLKNLRYTNSYKFETNPLWYTEFVHINDLTVISNVEDYETVLEYANEIYNNRSRSEESKYYGTWQTVHSSIYDLEELTLDIMVQENDIVYQFKLGD